MNVLQSKAAVGKPSIVPFVSLLAARTNWTTAPFDPAVSPIPSLVESLSDFAVWRQILSLPPPVQVSAQVVAPKIARVSVAPFEKPSPVSLTAAAGRAPATSPAPKLHPLEVR